MGALRFLLSIVHAAVVLLLLGVLCNAFVPPKFLIWPSFLAIAFPLLMALHLAFTLFWIVGFRKRAFIFILMTAGFYNPARRWVNFNLKNETPAHYRIITFNLNAFQKAKPTEIQSFLETRKPDFFLCQEARLPVGYRESFGFPYHFINDLQGIYSRYKIVKTGTLQLSGGGACYADVETGQGRLRLLNIYLRPFFLNKNMARPAKDIGADRAKARTLFGKMAPTFLAHAGEVGMIGDFIGKSPYPVVVGGDFNSVPNSYEYYKVSAGLQDAFLQVGSGSGTSFHDYGYPLRIDYFFTSKSITPVAYYVERAVHLSDHFPVVMGFNKN